MVSMSNITFILPDSLKTFVAEQTAKGGFKSEADYLQTLVRQAQIREAKQELENKLLDGLKSSLNPMSAEDWQELKQEVLQRNPEVNGP
jgi:Arc/MetJ-type ribon-helix-helix transcriptional regulator